LSAKSLGVEIEYVEAQFDEHVDELDISDHDSESSYPLEQSEFMEPEEEEGQAQTDVGIVEAVIASEIEDDDTDENPWSRPRWSQTSRGGATKCCTSTTRLHSAHGGDAAAAVNSVVAARQRRWRCDSATTAAGGIERR
jgi:hypothetical protein